MSWVSKARQLYTEPILQLHCLHLSVFLSTLSKTDTMLLNLLSAVNIRHHRGYSKVTFIVEGGGGP